MLRIGKTQISKMQEIENEILARGIRDTRFEQLPKRYHEHLISEIEKTYYDLDTPIYFGNKKYKVNARIDEYNIYDERVIGIRAFIMYEDHYEDCIIIKAGDGYMWVIAHIDSTFASKYPAAQIQIYHKTFPVHDVSARNKEVMEMEKRQEPKYMRTNHHPSTYTYRQDYEKPE